MTFTKEQVYNESMEYFDNDELACNTFISKYALQDRDGNYLESNPDMMHKRLASEFARIEKNYPNPLIEEEIYSYFKGFKYIVPQGGPMASIGNHYRLSSLSNCVVVGQPKDSISGIFDLGKDMANLYKYRCGVGTDLSTLRPEGAAVNNSAKSTTGAWSFADFYSFVTNMVGQAGRRGACMITLNGNHPDVEKFITMKKDLKKVTGANISIKLSDEFMLAAKNNLMYPLEFGGKVYKSVKAKELFELICKTAVKTAEPGILFWDKILNDVPLQCYADVGFNHVGTNPCAELCLSILDACRLISINISNFIYNYDSQAIKPVFDDLEFARIVKIGVRLSDDLIDLEIEKLQAIIDFVEEEDVKRIFKKLQESAINGRRTGLGIHGLADLLLKLEKKYDEDSTIEFVRGVMSAFKNSAYFASSELARERGSFPVFNWEKEKDNKFINSLDPTVIKLIALQGRRNGSLLTIAPTGSVSILCQTSSGIEPVFRNSYTRRKKMNHDEKGVPDFVDNLGDKWKEYKVYHKLVKDYMDQHNITDENNLPDYFISSDRIDWKKRIEMQAALQSGIDHQISSTVNLPKGTSWETVRDIYMYAWEKGCKGITVYVDGSRSGVLISDESNTKEFKSHELPKRPDRLECSINHIQASGEKWTVLIGLQNGNPFEVFGGLSSIIQIPKKFEKGWLVKHSKSDKSIYDLVIGEGDEQMIIRDVVKTFDNPDQLSLCRIASLALRSGASPLELSNQLVKSSKEADFFSFAKGLSRVLKKFVKDGIISGDSCPQCSSPMVFEGGCAICKNCSFSKC